MAGSYDLFKKGDDKTLKISPMLNSSTFTNKTVWSVDRHLTNDLNVPNSSAHTGYTILNPKYVLMNTGLKNTVNLQDQCSAVSNMCNELSYSVSENKDFIKSSQSNDDCYNSVQMHCLSNDYSNKCEQVVLNNSDCNQNSEDVSNEVPMFDAFGFEDEMDKTGFYNEVDDRSHLVHTVSKTQNEGTIDTGFKYCDKIENIPVIEDLLIETTKKVDLEEYFNQNKIIEQNYGYNALGEMPLSEEFKAVLTMNSQQKNNEKKIFIKDLKSAKLKKLSSEEIEGIELESHEHKKSEEIPLTKQLRTQKIGMLKNNKSKKTRDFEKPDISLTRKVKTRPSNTDAGYVNLENCKKQKLHQPNEINKDESKPKKTKREYIIFRYFTQRELNLKRWQTVFEKQKRKNKKESDISRLSSPMECRLRTKDVVKASGNINVDKSQKIEKKLSFKPLTIKGHTLKTIQQKKDEINEDITNMLIKKTFSDACSSFTKERCSLKKKDNAKESEDINLDKANKFEKKTLIINEEESSKSQNRKKRVDLEKYFNQNEIIKQNNVEFQGYNALEERPLSENFKAVQIFLKTNIQEKNDTGNLVTEDLKSAKLKKVSIELKSHTPIRENFEEIPLTKELRTQKIVKLKDKSKKTKDFEKPDISLTGKVKAELSNVSLEKCKKQKLPQLVVSKPKKVKRKNLVTAYLKEREIITRKWQEKLENQNSSDKSLLSATKRSSLKKEDGKKASINADVNKAEKFEEISSCKFLIINEGENSKFGNRKKREDLIVKCVNSSQNMKQEVDKTSSDTSVSFTTKVSDPVLKKRNTSCSKKSSGKTLITVLDKDGKIRKRENDRFRFLQPSDAYKCKSKEEYKKFERRKIVERGCKLKTANK